MTRHRSFRLSPEGEDGRARWFLIPLFGLFVAIILVFFVLTMPGAVDGTSMEPTLHPEERFLGTVAYGAPRRGDVVVLDLRGRGSKEPVSLLKRIVAVPGDTVYVEGDIAWVNGEPEPSHALDSGTRVPVVGPLTLKKGEVFVLGDNRPLALDSRQFGPVPLSSVESRAFAVFWPPGNIRLIR